MCIEKNEKHNSKGTKLYQKKRLSLYYCGYVYFAKYVCIYKYHAYPSVSRKLWFIYFIYKVYYIKFVWDNDVDD